MTAAERPEESAIIQEHRSLAEAPFLSLSSVVPREWMKGSYLDLVAAVIRSGLRTEGPDYLRTEGGQYWCWVGNLDPEVVIRVAAKQDIGSYQKYHKGQALFFDNYSPSAAVVTKLC